jgi:hypothetical protein
MKKVTAILIAFFLTAFIIGSLQLEFAQASTPVIGILNSDTTWTKANSPYTLTGPTAVNKGVTLTIEPGVTVNLNGYYIQVNGTLTASGTSKNKIEFKSGNILFTSISNGWNSQTTSGSILEYCVLDNTTLTSTPALKLDNDQATSQVSVGDNSLISNNKLTNGLSVGDFSSVDGNILFKQVTVGNNSQVTHNTVSGGEVTTGSSCTVSYNTLGKPSAEVSSSLNAVSVGASTVISNNQITGAVSGMPSEISYNTITGGAETYPQYYYPFFGDYDSEPTELPTVDIDSVYCNIYSNQIHSNGKIAIQAQQATITANTISGNIQVTNTSRIENNKIKGSISGGTYIANNQIQTTSGYAVSTQDATLNSNVISGSVQLGNSAILKDNVIVGSVTGGGSILNNKIYGGVSLESASATLSGNLIKNGTINCNNYGVQILDNTLQNTAIIYAAGTIQHNLISGAEGITTGTTSVVITENTITKNTVGITVYTPNITISRNNIVDNTQNSVVLYGASDVEASNNWWGTTDTQAIGNKIHDSKSDFNLGTVNINPILTESNPDATPNPNIQLPTATPLPTQKASPMPTQRNSSLTGIFGDLILLAQRGLLGLLIFLFFLLIVLAILVTLLKRTYKKEERNKL